MLFAFLFIASLFTAIISGTIGMAGGITLFALMTLFMPLEQIIPIHGVVQLASNSSRLIYLRQHVRGKIFLYYLLGLPFGVVCALYVRKYILNPSYILLFVALIILYTLGKNYFSKTQIKIKERNFVYVGIVVGGLSILAGAVGPFLAVFFQNDDFRKEEIVATKASTQMVTHLAKIPAFLYLDFSFWSFRYQIAIMVIGALIGTKLGVFALHKINKRLFFFLFRSALLLASLRLIYKFFQELSH